MKRKTDSSQGKRRQSDANMYLPLQQPERYFCKASLFFIAGFGSASQSTTAQKRSRAMALLLGDV
jgi:hypothetical protein